MIIVSKGKGMRIWDKVKGTMSLEGGKGYGNELWIKLTSIATETKDSFQFVVCLNRYEKNSLERYLLERRRRI